MILRKIFEKGVLVGSKFAETFMGKGDMKYLVLYTIIKEPMHGYQIMNSIKEEFMGLYCPSPGTIYPTLQMLEEQGMVKGETKGGKKVYEITKKGKDFIKENKKVITKILKSVKDSDVIPQINKLAREFKNLGKETIELAMVVAEENKEKMKKKVKETTEVLKKMGAKLRQIWEE